MIFIIIIVAIIVTIIVTIVVILIVIILDYITSELQWMFWLLSDSILYHPKGFNLIVV